MNMSLRDGDLPSNEAPSLLQEEIDSRFRRYRVSSLATTCRMI